MSKHSIDISRGERFFNEVLLKHPPFSFSYGDKTYTGFDGLDVSASGHEDGGQIYSASVAEINGSLRVRMEAKLNREFGATEYTVYFENIGTGNSEVLTDVRALDLRFEGKEPVLRGNMGDLQSFYSAYEHDLTKGDKYFLSTGGRATHVVFPYFDLVHGDGGTMIASGWAGTWEGLFSYNENSGTRVRIKTDVTLRASLLPGETVRTGSIVMLPYKGRDYFNSTNLWREWFMKYILPKANAEGDPLEPFTTAGFMGDTGLPNSDGSISERYFTWRPTLEKIVKEDVKPDFRWFDAGWYCDPYGKTVPTDWWGTIGTWEIDAEKWPDDTFLESNEACHAENIKVFVWFEPERVTHVDGLVKNFGYKEEWAIGSGDSRTNDLGNPECLKWTLDRITKFLARHGVDMYREDNNSDPARAWPEKDKLETEKYGFPRYGITENKCIVGHYALWDGIIDFCAKHGKCPFVDSCASGGGRNDIESMKRGFPLMRSDYDRTTSSMRLSMTSTFPRWIPFHGSSTKETVEQLDDPYGKGTTAYVSRASFLPIYNFGAKFTHNPELDFDLMRNNIREWRSVSRLLTRDMYVLTPWHHEYDRDGWTAIAYDAPEMGQSVLLAFRMEDSDEKTMSFRLPFAEPDNEYNLRDADTGAETTLSGKELRAGLTLTLDEPKSSKMILFYRV